MHLSVGAAGSAADMMADLLMLANRFGLAVLPEVAAVFRCLITLEGTLALLSPGFNLLVEARGEGARLLRSQFSARFVKDMLVSDATSLMPMLRRLPRRLDRIVRTVERGDLGVRVRLLADREDRQVAAGMLDQTLTTFLGGATGVMAVLLMTSSAGPRITEGLSLYQAIGYHLLLLSSILIIRVLSLMLRH
jgi:ubiquinone biosynthesis protein